MTELISDFFFVANIDQKLDGLDKASMNQFKLENVVK